MESGRLQGILAKGLAFVVYTTFRWNNFNWDLFLLICSFDVNQPCPMLWYKPKFKIHSSSVDYVVIAFENLLFSSPSVYSRIQFQSIQFYSHFELNWTKIWPASTWKKLAVFFVFVFLNCDSSSSWSCMRTYSPHPSSPHPGTPGTPIWNSWRGCSSSRLAVEIAAFVFT